MKLKIETSLSDLLNPTHLSCTMFMTTLVNTLVLYFGWLAESSMILGAVHSIHLSIAIKTDRILPWIGKDRP